MFTATVAVVTETVSNERFVDVWWPLATSSAPLATCRLCDHEDVTGSETSAPLLLELIAFKPTDTPDTHSPPLGNANVTPSAAGVRKPPVPVNA